MRWEGLPDDVREEARTCIHAFLLPNSDDKEAQAGEHLEISPCKFSLEMPIAHLNA